VIPPSAIEELGSIKFKRSLMGYDRHAVDAFVESLRSELRSKGLDASLATDFSRDRADDRMRIAHSIEAVTFNLAGSGYVVDQVDQFLSRVVDELKSFDGASGDGRSSERRDTHLGSETSGDVGVPVRSDYRDPSFRSSTDVTYCTTRTRFSPRVVFAGHLVLAVGGIWVLTLIDSGISHTHRGGIKLILLSVAVVGVMLWTARLIPLFVLSSRVTLTRDQLVFAGVLSTHTYALSELTYLGKSTLDSRAEVFVGIWSVFDFGNSGTARIVVGQRRRFVPLVRALRKARPDLKIDPEWLDQLEL